MVTVFYVFCSVLCVAVCARGDWFFGVLPPLAHTLYNISYYGIILGVGISIVVLDTYTILFKYLARENGGREKITNQLCVFCVVKNSHLL
jgi:hypothetical protein